MRLLPVSEAIVRSYSWNTLFVRQPSCRQINARAKSGDWSKMLVFAPWRRYTGPTVMATDASNPEEIVAATRARYGVLGFLCSLSFILYIDRICISQAATN